MQLSGQRLTEQLPQELRSLYTLYGDEALLLQEAADAIRATARQQGFSERHVFTVAGAHFDWSEVESAASAMSLFADKQLIDIRIPSGKPGKEGSEALQRIAAACVGNDGILVLLSLPRLDKTAKSSALQLQRVRAGEEGQRSLQFFADRVEGNLLAAHQEIQKLALLYPAQELSFEDIENAVLNVARFNVFKLSETVLAGQHQRVQRMLDGLRAEGTSEVLVHFALAEDIRALKRVKDAVASGRALPQVLREQRIWGPKERLFERVLPRLSPAVMDRLLQAAHQVDGVVKGLRFAQWPSDSWQALARLALMLSKACQTA